MLYGKAETIHILQRQSPAALVEVYSWSGRFLDRATPQEVLKVLETSGQNWDAVARGGAKRPRVFCVRPKFQVDPARSNASATTKGTHVWSRRHHTTHCEQWPHLQQQEKES
jgi:hypothetical protein